MRRKVMRKPTRIPLPIRALILLVGGLTLLGDSCDGGGGGNPPPDYLKLVIEKADEILRQNAGKDVAIGLIRENGSVVPERLILRNDLHFAVWVVEGKNPNFVWASGSPEPFAVKCVGPLCFSLSVAHSDTLPLEAEYSISFTSSQGAQVKADPHLEVVH
jgi:hypothetical protein